MRRKDVLQQSCRQATDFSVLGAHLPLGHVSRFDPKVYLTLVASTPR